LLLGPMNLRDYFLALLRHSHAPTI
jgi:hypothetical protein